MTTALQPGAVLDGYEIVSLLGKGGMGAVYRVRRGSTDFALKTLEGIANTPESVARFRREAEVLASLSHPSLVRVHAAGEVRGTLYFVMSLVEGESLDARLRHGRLSEDESIGIVRQVALAIAHAHERGVIHRDLKPANVLLEKDGHALVADFGLARQVQERDRLTLTGEVIGTPNYLAPEQALGNKDELDHKTDIYGLGAILYACLSGQPPFDGPTAMAVLTKVATTPPPRLEGVSPALAAVVERAMAKKREHRPPTVAAFLRQLEAAAQEGEPAGLPRSFLVGLSVVALACVAGTAFLLATRLARKPAPPPPADDLVSGRALPLLDAATSLRTGRAGNVEGLIRGALAGTSPGERAKLLDAITLRGDAALERQEWERAGACYEIARDLLHESSGGAPATPLRRRLLAAGILAGLDLPRAAFDLPVPEEWGRPPLLEAARALHERALASPDPLRAVKALDAVPIPEGLRPRVAAVWLAEAARIRLEWRKEDRGGLPTPDKIQALIRRLRTVNGPYARALELDPTIGPLPGGVRPMFLFCCWFVTQDITRQPEFLPAWREAFDFKPLEKHPVWLYLQERLERPDIERAGPHTLARGLALHDSLKAVLASGEKPPDSVRVLAHHVAMEVLWAAAVESPDKALPALETFLEIANYQQGWFKVSLVLRALPNKDARLAALEKKANERLLTAQPMPEKFAMDGEDGEDGEGR